MMGRKIKKLLFWASIIVLLLMPLGLIYQISLSEMEEYKVSDSPVIRQSSIGSPVQARRADLDLYVTVSGTFTSTGVEFMELNYKKPYEIRWIVSYGDEIQVDQLLGYYNGKEVRSTVEGKIATIDTASSKPYIMVNTFVPLVLECSVDDATLKAVKQFRDSLFLEDGTTVAVAYIEKSRNSDGTTMVRFVLNREGDSYGTAVEDLVILLGTSYPQVLTLPLDCIYQKTEGEEEPWYVRQVTEDGFLISEQQVVVSYTDKATAVVSGIEEGQWFDSGYKVVVSGDDK